MQLRDIHLRDPFVYVSRTEGVYYLFGTTDEDPWRSPGVGFDVFRSADLAEWTGPTPAFHPSPGFWATTNFWAPEVHEYRGAYYLFASFKSPDRRRATQILRSDRPEGPYRVHSPQPVTPPEWECLDGTLHVGRSGAPWIVFCHEWVQIHDGEICACRLSDDLECPVGEPKKLFSAGSAPWTRPIRPKEGEGAKNYVTDGPFLYRTGSELLMLWSSFTDNGYAMGIAHSPSGDILGPWIHEETPIVDTDGGHGMVFRDLEGRLHITVHSPNSTPNERPVFIPVTEEEGTLTSHRRLDATGQTHG